MMCSGSGDRVPLIQHLIYGVVLGVTFGLLVAWVPGKATDIAQPTGQKAKAAG